MDHSHGTLLKALKQYLPGVQFWPSPKYPSLHVHLYDPAVLLQWACSLQFLLEPWEHSSISIKKKKIILVRWRHLPVCFFFFYIERKPLVQIPILYLIIHQQQPLTVSLYNMIMFSHLAKWRKLTRHPTKKERKKKILLTEPHPNNGWLF